MESNQYSSKMENVLLLGLGARCRGSSAGSPGRPLRTQHGKDMQVHEVIVQPLGLPGNPLPPEAKPAGDGAAAGVADSTPDFESMESERDESVVCHPRGCTGHDPLSLERFGEPVSHHRRAVQPVDTVIADDADQFVAVHDTRGQTLVPLKLLERELNEGERFLPGALVVHPREPLSQVRTVRVDEGEELIGMTFDQKLKLDFVIDGEDHRLSSVIPEVAGFEQECRRNISCTHAPGGGSIAEPSFQ
jgi:hypothetical protein